MDEASFEEFLRRLDIGETSIQTLKDQSCFSFERLIRLGEAEWKELRQAGVSIGDSAELESTFSALLDHLRVLEDSDELPPEEISDRLPVGNKVQDFKPMIAMELRRLIRKSIRKSIPHAATSALGTAGKTISQLSVQNMDDLVQGLITVYAPSSTKALGSIGLKSLRGMSGFLSCASAVAVSAVDCGLLARRYFRGEITTYMFYQSCGRSVVSAGAAVPSAALGMEICAALGTAICPFLGTILGLMLGAFVGGAIGALLSGTVFHRLWNHFCPEEKQLETLASAKTDEQYLKHLDKLGVSDSTEPREIKQRKKHLQKLWHPDKHRDQSAETYAKEFSAICMAYEIIEKRREAEGRWDTICTVTDAKLESTEEVVWEYDRFWPVAGWKPLIYSRSNFYKVVGNQEVPLRNLTLGESGKRKYFNSENMTTLGYTQEGTYTYGPSGIGPFFDIQGLNCVRRRKWTRRHAVKVVKVVTAPVTARALTFTASETVRDDRFR
jgi:hypothetical protein